MRRLRSAFTAPTEADSTNNYSDIITVPDDDSTNIPRSMLVGNVQLTTTVEALSNVNSFNNMVIAVMRVPRDTTINSDFIDLHPEWVLAYKYIGSPISISDAQQFQPVRVSSRKKVRLYSGDSVKLIVQYSKSNTTVPIEYSVEGEIRLRTRLE